MSGQTSVAENAEQLLQLLLHLKNTEPSDARAILNSQPPIASALIALMVNVGAMDPNIVQRTLSEYHASQIPAAPTPIPAPTPTPASSRTPLPPQSSLIPPHLQAARYGRTETPPQVSHTPPMYPGRGQPPPAAYPQSNYAQPPPDPRYNYSQGYNAPPPAAPAPAPAPAPTPATADLLANAPPEQRQILQSLLSLTPEQIYALPPTERDGVLALRATFGL